MSVRYPLARLATRVLVVDDSTFIQRVVRKRLELEDDLEVVGTASDPFEARDLIKKLRPDIITLDIEMPRMDGITFLSKLMKHHPLPVVVFSGGSGPNKERAMKALVAGAVAIVEKPSGRQGSQERLDELVVAVRQARGARVQGARQHMRARLTSQALGRTDKIVAVGSSTGGPRALDRLLAGMPKDGPGVVIAQHMPSAFSASFAKRLDRHAAMTVQLAEHGMRVEPGLALLAPGGRHMRLKRRGSLYRVELFDGPKVQFNRPSVDVLFESVAQSARDQAIGVLLTGMGKDGAQGMLQMKDVGAYTIAESEESAVVYGMPRAAVELGAACEIARLDDMADRVVRAAFEDAA